MATQASEREKILPPIYGPNKASERSTFTIDDQEGDLKKSLQSIKISMKKKISRVQTPKFRHASQETKLKTPRGIFGN